LARQDSAKLFGIAHMALLHEWRSSHSAFLTGKICCIAAVHLSNFGLCDFLQRDLA
jgi:hypothetical protein